MPESTAKPAVVLLSGGMDSATVCAMALAEGYIVHALSFRYGQRHLIELEAAKRVADALKVHGHLVIDVQLSAIGGSALTDTAIPVPMDRDTKDHAIIPSTYVPARNTVFLSLALAYAEALGAEDIFIGANAVDYSGYPDCRPGYLRAFEHMANLATKASLEGRMHFHIHAPLINMTKQEIIKRGQSLGLDYSLTWSCYSPTPEGKPCGRCDSCQIRNSAFGEAPIQ